jgi:hypothetical protein
MMPLTARQKKFPAIGEHATASVLLSIRQSAGPGSPRRVTPGGDGPCLRFCPATGSRPGSAKRVLPIFTHVQ